MRQHLGDWQLIDNPERCWRLLEDDEDHFQAGFVEPFLAVTTVDLVTAYQYVLNLKSNGVYAFERREPEVTNEFIKWIEQ